MPRKKRISLDTWEAQVQVPTSLPVSVAVYLNETARRRLTTRSALIREAVVQMLHAEDAVKLADDADAEVIA